MERFSYDMDNMHIVCRTEEELKKTVEIGSIFGYLPQCYDTVDKSLEIYLRRFKQIKSENKKAALVFYVNEETMFTSMYVCEVSHIGNKHKIRRYNWLEQVMLEYVS